jgi:uncharacterized HAD superfamily protein
MKIQRPKGKLVCIDLDGTLCKRGFPNVDPLPIHEAIMRITELHEMGAHIIICTSRQEKWYVETKAWLVKYRVPFVAIAMRHKPQADFYIDDRSIDVREWIHDSKTITKIKPPACLTEDGIG